MILFEPLNPTTITVNGLGNADASLSFSGHASPSALPVGAIGSLSFSGKAYAFGRAPGEGLADGTTGFYGFASAAIPGARGDGLLAFDGAARFGSTLVPEFPVIGAGLLEFAAETSTGYFRTQVNEPEGTLTFDGFASSAAIGGFVRDATLSFYGDAITTAPVFELVGAVNLFTQAYGVLGFTPVTQVEDVQLSTSMLIDLSILVEQRVPLVDLSGSSMELSRSISEEVVLAERISLIYRLLQTEGVLLGDLAASDYTAVARVIDTLLLTGSVANIAEAQAVVVAAVAMGLRVDTAIAMQVQEQLAAGADFTELLTVALGIVEALQAVDLPTMFGTATLVVPESLAIGASLSSSAELANVIREAARFALRLSLDTGEYVAWAINTESKHLSSYAQFPVNSFAVLGGRVLAASSDGIYALEGATDDGEPIAARVRFALTRMGTGLQKRIPEAFIGYTASGDVLVKVIVTDEADGKEAHVYRLAPRRAGAPVQGRSKFGRGLRSVYVGFELENVDGANFELDTIEVHPLVLESRTRGNGQGR